VCRCVFGAGVALPGRKVGGEDEMRDDRGDDDKDDDNGVIMRHLTINK